MKPSKSFLTFALSFSLVFVSFLSYSTQTVFAQQQDSRIALQRGYRTGYSDGYMSGYRDAIDNQTKNYGRHGEYAKADRAFSKEYGSVTDYRDGYQQGFETGYDTGFGKSSFDAAIPTDLSKRGIVTVKADIGDTATTKTPVIENPPTENTQTYSDNQSSDATTTTISGSDSTEQAPILTARTENANSGISGETTILIPSDTELIVELLDDLNTDRNREGDIFKARIVSPSEISGAIIEGRISKIQKPGRIKRRAEMLLSFDRLILSANRWSNFNAIVTEVVARKGDNVKRVDVEGTVEGKRTWKEDSIKVGATTGTGLVIGAVAGGPVGAAVGAGVGAAFGVGAVVVERGKHIRLDKDQQLRIKSSYETQIR